MRPKLSWFRYAGKVLLLVAAYYFSGRLGLWINSSGHYATLAWPPTGISLAALLLYDNGLWPGIFIGALLVNLTVGAVWPAAAGMAMGNTLEAVAGAYGLRRFVGFQISLQRIRDVIGLVLVAALLSTAISATVGATMLWWQGVVKISAVRRVWKVWWFGNVLGDLAVAPLLLTWASSRFPNPFRRWPAKRFAEALLLSAALIGTHLLVFNPLGLRALEDFPYAYLIFPPLIWASIRFGPQGATLAVFITSILSIWRTTQGIGPFHEASITDRLASLQIFLGVASVTALIIAAVAAEREQAQAGLEQKIADRTQQLAAANQELEAFSYSVSHDLRTPLRAIDGFSEEILANAGPSLDPRSRGDLQRVRAATQRMAQLIEDLLELSQLSRREIKREMIDLTALVTQIVQELRSADPQRVVDFRVTPELKAVGDSRLLYVALENLLGNAWKFTARQAQPRIEFGVSGESQKKAFFVRDNGVGFNMAYSGKLFGAFQRLHDAKEFPGTGIGLATAKRVIHRHGGLLWAEAAENRGATFYFTLP